MKPRYLIQINFNEPEYLQFLKLLKIANVGKTQLIKTALFDPDKYQEITRKGERHDGYFLTADGIVIPASKTVTRKAMAAIAPWAAKIVKIDDYKTWKNQKQKGEMT